jgi:acyl-CoA reductase-like NAD-dependent aldehyde dehydrogenase
MKTTFPYLCAGRWSSEGVALEVQSPYDGSCVAVTYRPHEAALEASVTAAERAFQTTRSLPAYQKSEILQKIAVSMHARSEELSRWLALEAGKPLKTARAEVDRAAMTMSVAATESLRIGGEYLPLDLLPSTRGRWALVRRFPLGPILSISPFNFPLNLVAHKWGPAMAAGNTLVHKPATKTPISSLLLAEIAAESGWPMEALNVLPIAAAQAERLVGDDRLKMLTFTGSPAVGWPLKARAGKKRVTLELGGNAGVIIHEDADLKHAVERCLFGGFSYAGQSCISVQRIFVHRRVETDFLEMLLKGVQALRCGDPLDETVDVGPLISEDDAIRAQEWIREAARNGAQVLTGGERDRSILQPTVLTATRPEMKVNCLEIFAPVVTVTSYERFEQAVDWVNDSRYGLQAGLFTRDVRLIFDAYDRLEVGGVIVGDVPTFRIDHMPYGGVKDSGTGREGIRYAIEEMTEMKLLAMNLQS